MGNALTTASVSAADVIVPVSQQIIKPESHKTEKYRGEPPSKCPMHKSGQLNTINYVSECPIDKMDINEINPLNMVRIRLNLLCLVNKYLLCLIV